MRQIVYVILGLIALFTVVRAYGVYVTDQEMAGPDGYGSGETVPAERILE